MQYRDRVYGPVLIDEPVLVELMQSAAVQRLRGVLQHGITGLIGVTAPTTRFDHSAGAMLLVRRLNGSLDEQIAALLHDVSHTAFSHVIDYVLDGHDRQSYHEEVKEEYLSGTDVPALLDRHGHDWRRFLDEGDFPLLEQPAPRLCADRLDYFLRDSRELGLAPPEETQNVLAHLVVHEGRIVVDDLPAAGWLARAYLAADEKSWSNFREVGLYELTARAIRTGLSVGVLTRADFWGADEQVWRKLQGSRDPELQEQLKLISLRTRFVWDEASPTFCVSTKIRTIDPDVLLNDKPHPLSALDGEYARLRQEYLSRKAGKWPMRVIPG